jgi:hypothetical protein
MVSTMTRAEEKVIGDLAYIAGGEAALEQAILRFRARHGRTPDGPELLRQVATMRLARMRAEEAGR